MASTASHRTRGPTGLRPAQVDGVLGGRDPFESIKQTLADGRFDDVIISTLPKRRSAWLRRDLPHRVEQLGVPVSVITQPPEKRVGLEDIGMAAWPS
jgi:hypothetical protein